MFKREKERILFALIDVDDFIGINIENLTSTMGDLVGFAGIAISTRIWVDCGAFARRMNPSAFALIFPFLEKRGGLCGGIHWPRG